MRSPSVEGERRSIFYSLRVHEVLMLPESFSQWDQRTWITQGLLAKGILKAGDLVVQCISKHLKGRFVSFLRIFKESQP